MTSIQERDIMKVADEFLSSLLTEDNDRAISYLREETSSSTSAESLSASKLFPVIFGVPFGTQPTKPRIAGVSIDTGRATVYLTTTVEAQEEPVQGTEDWWRPIWALRSRRTIQGSLQLARSRDSWQIVLPAYFSDPVEADAIDVPDSLEPYGPSWALPEDFNSIPAYISVAPSNDVEIKDRLAKATLVLNADVDHLIGTSRRIPEGQTVEVEIAQSDCRISIGSLHAQSSRMANSVLLDSLVHVGTATTLRFRFGEWSLPIGTKIYAIGTDRHMPPPITISNLTPADGLWSPSVFGDTVLIRIEIPADKLGRHSFRITDILEGHRGIAGSSEYRTSNLASNGQDATCKNDSNTQNSRVPNLVPRLRSGVGLLAIVTPIGGTFWIWRICTGTLIRRLSNDADRQLLCANHCFVEEGSDGLPARDATQSDIASAEVIWDYRNESCDQNGTQNWSDERILALPRSAGASLRASSRQTDVVLFSVAVVPGARTLMGWQRGLRYVDDGYHHRVSHPAGRSQSYSWEITDYIDDNGMQYCGRRLPRSYFYYSWERHDGSVRPGSSGSALVNQRLRITGQLYGSCRYCRKRCINTHVDGRINASWAQLRQWLL